MSKLEGVLATSHVDRHGDQVSVEALRSLVEQVERTYIPQTMDHDPRIPPVGRLVSAELRVREDGEFEVFGTTELFDEGEPPYKDDGRLMPIATVHGEELEVFYDRSYENDADRETLDEIRGLTAGRLQPELKKAFEPLSLLALAGVFAIGAFAGGFLNKMGSDAWDATKEKLKELFRRKREMAGEHLFSFRAVVQRGEDTVLVETILTNPSDDDLDRFFSDGLRELDGIVPRLLETPVPVRKLVMEYSDGRVRFLFGVRKDAVPFTFGRRDPE